MLVIRYGLLSLTLGLLTSLFGGTEGHAAVKKTSGLAVAAKKRAVAKPKGEVRSAKKKKKEKTEDKKGGLIDPFETDDSKLPPATQPGGGGGGGGGKLLDPFAPGAGGTGGSGGGGKLLDPFAPGGSGEKSGGKSAEGGKSSKKK